MVDDYYICDVCDTLGRGDSCWFCGDSENLYRGPGAKWPGSAGRRDDAPRSYGGHTTVNHAESLYSDEPDITWQMILDDVGEPDRRRKSWL